MPIRIIAMGDSTTAGTPGWKSPIEAPPNGEGDETSQYAHWLMTSHPGWLVLNRGVNGERSDQILARFDRDVLDAQPGAVVIIAGVNDVYQGRQPEHVIAQLQQMYERAHRAGIAVVAGSIIPYNTATPDQNDRMRQVNAWIEAHAHAHPHLYYVDTRGSVSAPQSRDLLIDTVDQLHPSAAGYRLMAGAISLVLERALSGRAASMKSRG